MVIRQVKVKVGSQRTVVNCSVQRDFGLNNVYSLIANIILTNQKYREHKARHAYVSVTYETINSITYTFAMVN